jgi:hypothetical protein
MNFVGKAKRNDRRKGCLKKIDIFTHILPLRYKVVLEKKARPGMYMNANNAHSALWDLSIWLDAMSRFEDLSRKYGENVAPASMKTGLWKHLKAKGKTAIQLIPRRKSLTAPVEEMIGGKNVQPDVGGTG